MHNNITISISLGEFLDRFSILEIKSLFTNNSYVLNELKELTTIKSMLTTYVEGYLTELREVNKKLWKIENELRQLEELKIFDDRFVSLAREVYQNNDLRSQIKKKINIETNSEYQEVKIFNKYQ